MIVEISRSTRYDAVNCLTILEQTAEVRLGSPYEAKIKRVVTDGFMLNRHLVGDLWREMSLAMGIRLAKDFPHLEIDPSFHSPGDPWRIRLIPVTLETALARVRGCTPTTCS